jgi:hypothetical protein
MDGSGGGHSKIDEVDYEDETRGLPDCGSDSREAWWCQLSATIKRKVKGRCSCSIGVD